MDINGLDYNTQRDKLTMPEYGRVVQCMVEHAVRLDNKRDRQRCANVIIRTMERMQPQVRSTANYKQKLWDQLALMSDFKLDIDWPYDVSKAAVIRTKPGVVKYPMARIPVRHYGVLVFELFEKLKQMPMGPDFRRLMGYTANQMKRDLTLWGHGLADNEKVADDLAYYTDGKAQLDLHKFRFAKVDVSDMERRPRKRR